MPTYAEVVDRLRAAGCVYAEDEAVLLIDAAPDVAPLLARRVAGEPLEHVVGWAGFAGLRIEVRPGVFVPRARTELLARRAAALAVADATVVELCCGTGAVATLVRAVVPGATVHAADSSTEAVACARRNLGDERVYQGDLYDALPDELRGAVDVLVANAPYVPTAAIALMPPEARDHEPRSTLDGGDDGLDVLRRIIAGAPEWLTERGHLLFECSRDQVGTARTLVEERGFVPFVATDDDVEGTAVIARLPS